MARIAVAGFQHETNTFAPTKAGLDAFESGGGWPPMAEGQAALDGVGGTNIPLAGFVAAAQAAGHRLVPLVWANATPSAHVTREAFEHVAGRIVAALAAAGPVDAVYLDLHGAMVTEHLDDGEGEVLRRVRAVVGPRVPVAASLDLHANVTPLMVEHADAMVGYRTYPHVDMAATGERAAALLSAILARGDRPIRGFRQFPFLIPLTAQCTLIEPARGLYARLAALEQAHGVSLSFLPGFPAADIADCGPSLIGYGFDAAAVAAVVETLEREIVAAEPAFDAELLDPDEGVSRAMRIAAAEGGPVILADTQDNPGAGGNADTVGLLDALLRHRAEGAVLGLLVDGAAAAQAHAIGAGAEGDFSLGAKSGIPGHVPFAGRFRVERLGDGEFTCTGPFYGGARMRLGPMALLERDGVRVIVSTGRVQAADQEMFRHLGIEPARMRIVAVKSSVHYRAHFGPIATAVLTVVAPGPMAADPAALPWRKLRRGMRLRPRGPVFAGPA